MKHWTLLSILLVGCSSAAHQVAAEPSDAPPQIDDVAVQDSGPRQGERTDGGQVQDGDLQNDSSNAFIDGGGSEEQAPSGPPVVATDITISEIALFQGVKVPLMKNGAAVKSTYAPVVAGRPGLLRVYVKPSPSFRQRELTAELVLTNLSGTSIRQVKMIVTKSTLESELDSSMNFTIAAEDLPQGSSLFKVRLLGAPYVGTEPPAQYPADTSNAVLETAGSGKLRVVLVPVRYDADGSGRLPDTSASTVEQYRTAFFEAYPVTGVDVTVRSAMPWSGTISADKTGWNEVLQQVAALRAQDNPSSDTYYMGIFSPAGSFSTYCASGCVAGLAPLLTSASDVNYRAGVAIGYSNDAYALAASLRAAVHEAGHLHGRSHVGNAGTNPRCGTPSTIDAAFPYGGDGSIGSWGYGILGKQLYDPSMYTDFMGYCSDNWISDYTYGALLTRVQSVVPLTKSISLRGGEYRFVQISAEGNLRWGPTVDLPSVPTNNPTTVRATGSNGQIRNITGYYYSYGDDEGASMLVRKSDVNGMGLEIDYRGITRSLGAQ